MLGKGQVVLQRFPHFLLLVLQVGEEQVVARTDDRVTLRQDYTHANLGLVLVVEFCSLEVLWLSTVLPFYQYFVVLGFLWQLLLFAPAYLSAFLLNDQSFIVDLLVLQLNPQFFLFQSQQLNFPLHFLLLVLLINFCPLGLLLLPLLLLFTSPLFNFS